ncbi:MAG TPA: hypothetical protein VN914_04370 [Polyangia bacterium]|nr:hypothetical protein [Polyangia bacterium]
MLLLGAVETAVRMTAFWLAVAAGSVGGESLYYQSCVLWPDIFFPRLMVDAVTLLLVAVGAAVLLFRSSSCATPGGLTALVVGHLTAALGARGVLEARPTCFNMTESIDYWLPTETGPVWLFGPSLAVLVGCAVWRVAGARLRR